jgi:hypothetical protein
MHYNYSYIMLLVPNDQILDPNDPIHLRLIKSESILTAVNALDPLLSQYYSHIKVVNDLEIQIASELETFYQGNNVYNEFVNLFVYFIEKKHDLLKKDLNGFEKALSNIKEYNENFMEMATPARKYIKHSNLFAHYDKKMKVITDKVSRKAAENIPLSNFTKRKKQRNESKLQIAKDKQALASKRIIEISDKVNLDRFEKFNPLVSSIVSFNLAPVSLATRLGTVDYEYSKIFARKEASDFNDNFFSEIDQKQIDKMNKKRVLISVIPVGSQSAGKMSSSRMHNSVLDKMPNESNIRPSPNELSANYLRNKNNAGVRDNNEDGGGIPKIANPNLKNGHQVIDGSK